MRLETWACVTVTTLSAEGCWSACDWLRETDRRDPAELRTLESSSEHSEPRSEHSSQFCERALGSGAVEIEGFVAGLLRI